MPTKATKKTAKAKKITAAPTARRRQRGIGEAAGNEAPRGKAARYLRNSSEASTPLRQGHAELSSPSSPQQTAEHLEKENKILADEPKKKKVATAQEQTEVGKTTAEEPSSQTERYWEAVGRRKTAVARVRLYTKGEKGIWVNDKPIGDYFQYDGFLAVIEDPLKKMKSSDRFRVVAKVSGGGINAQSEAIRHGISRALVEFNPDFRKRLKRSGFLTRDSRMKERKKFGLKGARRAPQWAKR